MATQDFFAEIAMTQHPIGNNDKEIMPRTITDRKFVKSAGEFPYGSVKTAQDYTDEERYQQFLKGMDELRKKYAPFMENHLPEIEKVKKQELKEFDFRYLEEHEIFVSMQDSAKKWEHVTIPDYRGPEGKWRGYYKTRFAIQDIPKDHHVVIRFQSVDYKGLVYINGNYVGQHEGFFAPFEFDITDYVQEENELVLEVQNDYTTKGDDGPVVDGDKIYAATGPGWDDPEKGWHHCPPGAGILGRVTVEMRPQFCIDDIFPRPDIDHKCVELRVGVMNYEKFIPEDYEMEVRIMPKNFKEDSVVDFSAKMKVIGMGKNEYRYQVPMEEFRLWSPDTPYLYGTICTIKKDGQIISQAVKHFGMRKFVSDETTTPKGKFFLNNEPVILRGANEMGHLQQCVMNGDFNQLRDDILIAKYCNMNYYRITQRPVQEEIYDYMDMLGMMNQSDLPLFSTLRRNQVVEAVKQSGEMEHLLRSHPSAILVTFINEPVCIRRTEDPNSKYSKRYEMKGHRHVYRDELEAFFVAARKIIYIENPDRVIKNVEGDYDPPTSDGMPDFHTYTMWYSHHPMPVGKLIRGYIPPVKAGWMIGCGEYGAEGLDNIGVVERYWPKSWLAKDEEGNWYPTNIVRAQTNGMHGDWYEEKKSLEDWIEASQIHQAEATRIMTDAFRRRSDYLGHTAIHLLIDAWPAGWMKTLVDCDRVPKKAYYAYKDSLVPYRVNLRCDRKYVYAGETIEVEAWLLNDSSIARKGKIMAGVRLDGRPQAVYEIESGVDAAYSDCAGMISMDVPQVEEETVLTLDAAVFDEHGEIVNSERLEFYVYPKAENYIQNTINIGAIGGIAETFAKVCKIPTTQTMEDWDAMLVSMDHEKEKKADTDESHGESKNRDVLLKEVEKYLEQGGNVVLLLPDDKNPDSLVIKDLTIETKKCAKVYYAAAREDLVKYHFNWMYSGDLEYMDVIGRKYIAGAEGEELVYSYGKSGKNGAKAPKEHYPMVKKYMVGKGSLYVCSLMTGDKIGYNANLDKFIIDCLERKI